MGLTLTMLGNAQAACDTNLPETKPNDRYEEVLGANPEGSEVRDKVTGLIWQRCVVGLTYAKADNTCSGTENLLTYTQALDLAASAAGAAAPSSVTSAQPWRLPNRIELASLLEWRCTLPAINSTWFPNMPLVHSGMTWSSSPRHNFVNNAQLMAFDVPGTIATLKTDARLVRLVRTGLPENCSSFDSCSRNTGAP